jgi:hypothetical protein
MLATCVSRTMWMGNQYKLELQCSRARSGMATSDKRRETGRTFAGQHQLAAQRQDKNCADQQRV